ncbi:hypothetical protein [Paenarthrobacter sp. YIM B13468]|uniref:hypothetical protein n=1 Tax=Paenarthrobacter sp. YIM B13468 TaxID=3366295 RepID=UPI00366AF10A
MAGLDIVLDTLFNNPALPVVPILGFSDNFNRADGALGYTSGENKPWTFSAYPGTDVQAVISGNRMSWTGTTQYTVAHVDAGAANGTLKATLAVVDSAAGMRIAARVTNATNMILVRPDNTAGAEKLTLVKMISGTQTTVATSGTLGSLTGSVIEVVLNGTSISVKRNGVQVISPQTVTELATNTKHGVFINTGSPSARMDDVSFVAL